jgi:hypothetical protein
MLLRGRNKNMKKEGKLAEYLLLHIFPFEYTSKFSATPPLSRQSEVKKR